MTITYTSVQPADPESITKQVQSNPLFYWDQMQEYLKKNGIDPKELGLNDIAANNSLVIMLINSRNQIMYRNSASESGFKTPEEAKSDASVQALKKIIVEAMDKSGDSPVYFSLQNDIATSTDFVVHFINTTLPKAYDTALGEISARDKASLSDLRETHPLLLLYMRPKAFSSLKSQNLTDRQKFSKEWVTKGKYFDAQPTSDADEETLQLRHWQEFLTTLI